MMPREVGLQQRAIRKRIAAALHRARKSRAITILKAATDAGVTRHTWSRYESGEASIPAERLTPVAIAVGATAQQLLDAANANRKTATSILRAVA